MAALFATHGYFFFNKWIKTIKMNADPQHVVGFLYQSQGYMTAGNPKTFA